MDREGLMVPKDVCSICGSDYDDDAGGFQGYFGICPVTFCEWCYSSILDMTRQEFEDDIGEQRDK